jgi:pilus assembly protein CpaD
VTLLTSADAPVLQTQRTDAVRSHLQALGVPVASVARAKGLAIGPDTVVVSAESYSARAMNCPDWSKSGNYDPLNLPHSNLGCATARNIADMVENPRDLEVGRTPGPASGHLGAAAVDRLYNDKVKNPGTTQLGVGAGSGGGSSSSSTN